MDGERLAALAADLWADLGYDGCRELREVLRARMAEHRAAIAEARREAGLSRPRSTRKPTRSQQTAATMAAMGLGFSETSVQRIAAVRRYAPELEARVGAGSLSVWAAYREAVRIRDAAALEAARSIG